MTVSSCSIYVVHATMKKLHRIRGRDPPPVKVIPHPSRNDILSEMDLFGRTPAGNNLISDVCH